MYSSAVTEYKCVVGAYLQKLRSDGSTSVLLNKADHDEYFDFLRRVGGFENEIAIYQQVVGAYQAQLYQAQI